MVGALKRSGVIGALKGPSSLTWKRQGTGRSPLAACSVRVSGSWHRVMHHVRGSNITRSDHTLCSSSFPFSHECCIYQASNHEMTMGMDLEPQLVGNERRKSAEDAQQVAQRLPTVQEAPCEGKYLQCILLASSPFTNT